MIDRMDKWCAKSAFELFIKQADLATAIQDCHMEINDSLTKLQVCLFITRCSPLADLFPKVTAALETVAWQSEFEANNNRDRAEILRYLSDIKNTHSIIAMTQHQQSADIKAIMALMQQVRAICRLLSPSQPFDPLAESLSYP